MAGAPLARLVERLEWAAHDGVPWFDETREIEVPWVDVGRSAWSLRFATRLTNVADRSLVVGSPTTRGRPQAGYGSLFWRGLREFSTGGPVTSAGITDADAATGARAAWVAYHCPYDGDESWATMIFVDDPANPRYPTKWFVRRMPGYPAVSFALTYDEALELAPGEELSLDYRLIVADGRREAADVEHLLVL